VANTLPLTRPMTKPVPARRKIADAPICLLPGPVALAPAVQAALREPIVYHRAEEFLPLFEGVRERLSGMVGGKPVGLLVGSGTLANDAVAATLAAEGRPRCLGHRVGSGRG
jgi:aspartate aminotransferase-like enzyme